VVGSERLARIVDKVRSIVPQARIMGFPRGAGTNLGGYLKAVAIDAVGLDWTVGLDFARCNNLAAPPRSMQLSHSRATKFLIWIILVIEEVVDFSF
jgi:hypothetical protein